ncbi:YpjP family protein [Alkalihalobacterium elongatum]|uniref:YpjP family protein n=1 Tax=Alkalihalobacterium elongatum TaxID=2675466 RepID=UPI001C1FF4A8|nr:YpjP family protein [Alkalihalobacterium elongatum]
MKHWLRKSFFVAITILTLGTVTPPPHLYSNEPEAKSPSDLEISQKDKSSEEVHIITQLEEELSSGTSELLLPWDEVAEGTNSDELLSKWVDYTVHHADLQAMNKFGTKIKSKIEEDYRELILPKLEETITSISINSDEELLRNLSITNDPADGQGEKIFHVYDTRSGEDLYRFHVRRDQPPKQGYWFNFHYHTAADNFETHHELGTIFWDKNTPPNWMS